MVLCVVVLCGNDVLDMCGSVYCAYLCVVVYDCGLVVCLVDCVCMLCLTVH